MKFNKSETLDKTICIIFLQNISFIYHLCITLISSDFLFLVAIRWMMWSWLAPFAIFIFFTLIFEAIFARWQSLNAVGRLFRPIYQKAFSAMLFVHTLIRDNGDGAWGASKNSMHWHCH